MSQSNLPVAVIGAGPVGLAAAAHLIERGETPLVLESGAAVGASVLTWGHVQLFSPWRYVVDAAAERLLSAAGWQAPSPDIYPTGRELVEQYLAPLAALPEIEPHLRLGHRVQAVARYGFDKMKTPGREQAPFVVEVETADGRTEHLLAKAVIDASGSYTQPNPLGANGRPAIGEQALADRIFYGIPDVLGRERARYAGKRVLVAGSGHSAFNALLDLGALAEQESDTAITWVLRRSDTFQLYGGGADDQLEERGRLGQRMQELVETGRIQMVTGFKITRLTATPDGIVVSDGASALPPVDEIIATTGFRPDLAMLHELRLGLDSAVEAPSALAPLIDPNLHSCGSVPPHGVDELTHPEPGFYIVGMKSYGRAPTFLMLTGYEQARSVVAALVGDWESARDVQLVLPETGVCSTDRGESGGCCAPALAAPAAATSLINLTPVGGRIAAPVGGLQLVLTDSRADAAAGCCGGPAPAGADACCVQDAEAKASGQDGCGCGATEPVAATPASATRGCCG
jgi:thioredoxin reductase